MRHPRNCLILVRIFNAASFMFGIFSPRIEFIG